MMMEEIFRDEPNKISLAKYTDFELTIKDYFSKKGKFVSPPDRFEPDMNYYRKNIPLFMIPGEKSPVKASIIFETATGFSRFITSQKRKFNEDIMEKLKDEHYFAENAKKIWRRDSDYMNNTMMPNVRKRSTCSVAGTINGNAVYYEFSNNCINIMYVEDEFEIKGERLKKIRYIIHDSSREHPYSQSTENRYCYYDGSKLAFVDSYRKIPKNLSSEIDREGRLSSFSRFSEVVPKKHLICEYIVRVPGYDAMVKYFNGSHKNNKPLIKKPFLAVNELTEVTFSNNVEILKDEKDCLNALSRITREMYLPGDLPTLPERSKYIHRDHIYLCRTSKLC